MNEAGRGEKAAMYSRHKVTETTEAVVELGELAMQFGRIDRTGPQHKDGVPESDSDHTVMLCWIAPALAELINRRSGWPKHDVNRVAAYAAVHDAVEVYAGDTPTVVISEEELAQKEDREKEASSRLSVQFDERLPWFSRIIRHYERQDDEDARLVRSVDKMLPKIVHVICEGQDLVRSGFDLSDFRGVVKRQRAQVVNWCNDPLILAVYDQLTLTVETLWPVAPAIPQHILVIPVTGWSEMSIKHNSCAYVNEYKPCPAALALDKFIVVTSREVLKNLVPGEYPIEIDRFGELVFVGKQD